MTHNTYPQRRGSYGKVIFTKALTASQDRGACEPRPGSSDRSPEIANLAEPIDSHSLHDQHVVTHEHLQFR